MEAPDDVRTQEPAKSSGVLERIAPGFDQGLHEPVRVRPGDRMEQEPSTLDELPKRRPGRYRHQVAGLL